MSDICEFRVTLSGSKEQLECLGDMLMKATSPMPENPETEQFILDLNPEVWGDCQHNFLWVNHIEYYAGRSMVGKRSPEQNELRIDGESRYAPPLVFIDRILDRFPDLRIDLRATTAYEHYERWYNRPKIKTKKRLICAERQLTNIQTGQVMELEINGRKVITGGAIAPPPKPGELDEDELDEEGKKIEAELRRLFGSPETTLDQDETSTKDEEPKQP